MGFGSFPAWLGRVVGEGDIVVLWLLVAWVLWLLVAWVLWLLLVWAVARFLELSVSVSVGCSGLLSAPASPQMRQLGGDALPVTNSCGGYEGSTRRHGRAKVDA